MALAGVNELCVHKGFCAQVRCKAEFELSKGADECTKAVLRRFGCILWHCNYAVEGQGIPSIQVAMMETRAFEEYS